MQILIADQLGRRRFMQLQCVIVTIGAAIQTGSVDMGMFLAGRILSGIAVGFVDIKYEYKALYTDWLASALSGTVPVYLSEVSRSVKLLSTTFKEHHG